MPPIPVDGTRWLEARQLDHMDEGSSPVAELQPATLRFVPLYAALPLTSPAGADLKLRASIAFKVTNWMLPLLTCVKHSITVYEPVDRLN
jgi:hypothetical protein